MVTPPTESPPADRRVRLTSLDAYRGFIMLAMASGGLAVPQVARKLAERSPGDPAVAVWTFLAGQLDHVEWVGCSFWDLIQPSFLFMVGVALPYSYASRRARGDSEAQLFRHVLVRSLLLVVLAVFLSSPFTLPPHHLSTGAAAGVAGTLVPPPPPQTNFTFVNVLAQIGLGYVFVYLLVGRGLRLQLAAVAVLLAGYTLWFGLHPLPGPDFDPRDVGLDQPYPWLTGWFAHWNKNTNAAAAFDLWFLNLFPRPEPFRYNSGGYQTLNFVPSVATMALGLTAGELLRGPTAPRRKLAALLAAGALCLSLGWLAGQFVCPLVKRIWTPSWAVYSAGWTFLMLAGFYWVIDLKGHRRWAFPLVVVGMNSILMYCMAQLLKSWVAGRLRMHLGARWFEGLYGPVVQSAAVLLVFWLVCLWLYRRKIFIRV